MAPGSGLGSQCHHFIIAGNSAAAWLFVSLLADRGRLSLRRWPYCQSRCPAAHCDLDSGTDVYQRGLCPRCSSLTRLIFYITGIFEQATTSFRGRATVETGRFLCGRSPLSDFSAYSWVLSDLGTYIPSWAI
jgi:hypothetical protein